MNDIECKVCHRITFAHETNINCPACHWPVRPVVLTDPAFGYEVAIKVRNHNHTTAIVEKHFCTPTESAARSRAKRTSNFIEIAAMRPLTETQWLNSYGDPRDKTRFS